GGGYHEWTRHDPQANRYQIEDNRLKRNSGVLLREAATWLGHGGAAAGSGKAYQSAEAALAGKAARALGSAKSAAVGGLLGVAGEVASTLADYDIGRRDRRAVELEANRAEIARRERQVRSR